MTKHTLSASQFIARPIDEVFAFFAEPRNLARITPSTMSFEFLSDDFDMREGLEIAYRLKPLLGVPHTDHELRAAAVVHRYPARRSLQALGAPSRL